MKRSKERKTKLVGVMVTESEYEVLRAAAFDARKSVSAFVRDVLVAKTKKVAK